MATESELEAELMQCIEEMQEFVPCTDVIDVDEDLSPIPDEVVVLSKSVS